MVCSKAVWLLLAFVCLASAKHKTLNKFNFCDLFPIKKPHAVTDSPPSTTPLSIAYVGSQETVQVTAVPEYASLSPVLTQQEVQYPAHEPELLNPQQELESSYEQELQNPPQQELQYPPQQELQYPPQQELQYLPHQIVQYPPQQIMHYPPLQVMPHPSQQVVQPTQQGQQYQVQHEVKYPLPEVPSQQQQSQYQYPQDLKYPIPQQQEVQPPKQESHYQPQHVVKDQQFHQEIQPPQKFQYQQKHPEVKPPQYSLEYQSPQQEVQNQPTHEVHKPQLGHKFPPQQGIKLPPQQGNPSLYFQGPSNNYGSSELSYYQQQTGPNRKSLGYFDNQNNFQNQRPYYVYTRQQHPDSSQYFYSNPYDVLPPASVTPHVLPQKKSKST